MSAPCEVLDQPLEAVTLLYLSEKWGSKVGEEIISSWPTVAYIWGDRGERLLIPLCFLPILATCSLLDLVRFILSEMS